jgi:hypothetical protein
MVQERAGLDGPLAKIAGEALQDFARMDRPAERQSVIVELAAPPREVPRSFELTKRPGLPSAPSREDLLGSRALTPHGSLLDDLAGQIQSRIGPKKLVRIDSAEAMVLDVSPAELRTICEMPLVGSIRPNRKRRV